MDYIEMAALAQSPTRVRSLAGTVKALLGPTISANELDFLSKLEKFSNSDTLSIRQKEFLWALKEKTSRSRVEGRYRASKLVQLLWEARCDLSYPNEENIKRLRVFGDQLALSRSQWRWVFALCRDLNIVEDEYISLN